MLTKDEHHDDWEHSNDNDDTSHHSRPHSTIHQSFLACWTITPDTSATMKILVFSLLLSLLHKVETSPPMMTQGTDGDDEISFSLSFDDFLIQFRRSYTNPLEYNHRKQIYERNLRYIESHNRKNHKKYRLAVNEFADRIIPDEVHRGYDKYASTHYDGTASQRRRLEDATKQLEHAMGGPMDPVEELPPFVDWRQHFSVTTPVKSQGMCGSCWAFASVTALESHIALQTSVLYELSPQEFVSCASNEKQCGGQGGCSGATAEIAYELVKERGIVSEWEFGYQDSHGAPVNCTVSKHTKETDDGKKYYSGAVAGITGYVTLPSNNYTVLMNTVAKLGPVAVSVACEPWIFYQRGVFDAPLSTGKNTDLDHLVVLEGYGTDQDTGEHYWLVRNSWGPKWGENGYIRLLRHSAETTPCGMDETPQDGTACTLDPDGNEIVPEPQMICGTSGILFDSAIPIGGFLVN